MKLSLNNIQIKMLYEIAEENLKRLNKQTIIDLPDKLEIWQWENIKNKLKKISKKYKISYHHIY